MSGANTAGICGPAVLTMEATLPGRRTDSSGVRKAAETVPALPLTGSRVLPGVGTPTCSPSARRVLLTCCTSAALGP